MSKKNIFLSVILTLIAESFVFFIHTDIRLISDWLGEMAFPAHLAGRDWSSALASCSYYGWGLTWIYTPIFLVSSNAVTIWYGYKIFNIIIISVISIIIYVIQIKWMRQKENAITIMISVSVALLTWIDFGKETTLIFGIWVSVLLFLETFYSEKERNVQTKLVLSIVTPAVTCYIKNIHESAICLSIIILFLAVWDYFVAKKKSVYISAFLLSWGVTYVISNAVKALILKLYTADASREVVYNTSAFQGVTLWFLDTWKSVKLLALLIWSNFYTLIVWTYGLALFAVLLIIVVIVNAVQKKKLAQVISNGPIQGVLFYSLLSTMVVVAGVAVNWGNGLYNGVRIGGKAFNYIRYYYPFFFPSLVACFSCLRQKTQDLKKIKRIAFFLTHFCIMCYFAVLYPVMLRWSDSGGHVEWGNAYGFCFIKSATISYNIFAWSLFVMVFMAVMFWIKNEKKYLLLMTILCVFSISERRMEFDLYGDMQNKLAFPSFEISAVSTSEKVIHILIESDIDMDDIYLIDSGSYYIYSLQFLLNDIPLQCITSADDLDRINGDSIMLSSESKLCDYIGPNYERIQLAEGEFLYAQDVEIISAVKAWLGE